MIPEALAIIITLLLAPLAFFILSRKGPSPKFPLSMNDGVGDIILLPVFNAIAVHYGILEVIPNYSYIAIAAGVAYILGRIFMIYRKDFAKHDDWSRPKRGQYSVGGWYRQIYMFIQAFFVFISLLYFYDMLLLWIPLITYAILVGIMLKNSYRK